MTRPRYYLGTDGQWTNVRPTGAILPAEGERLTFGQHRLADTERYCPAWPKNPATVGNAAYTRWIRGARGQISHPDARADMTRSARDQRRVDDLRARIAA